MSAHCTSTGWPVSENAQAQPGELDVGEVPDDPFLRGPERGNDEPPRRRGDPAPDQHDRAMPWAAVYQPTITTVATYPRADSGVKCQSAATSQ